MLVFAATFAHAAEQVVDEVEVVADTNIVVVAGDTLRIERLWAAAPHTVTKTGGGRLVLAVLGGGDNVILDIQEGTLASARPGSLPCQDELAPNFHGDASQLSTFTFSQSGGKSWVTQWRDADGRAAKAGNWDGFDKPFLATKTQNGLNVLDFGPFKPAKDGTYGGTLGVTSTNAKEYFYVWEDHEEVRDLDPSGGAEFNGPQVIGNTWELNRGLGGCGKDFCLATSGAPGSLTPNLHLDRQQARYNTRVTPGFHLFHNYKSNDSTVTISTLGYSNPRGGGMRLAEILLYTDFLSDAARTAVEDYLESKWFGARIGSLSLGAAATLDVSAVKFNIGSLSAAGGTVVGCSNLVYATVSGTVTIAPGEPFAGFDVASGEMPDVNFDGDARVSVAGPIRVGNLTSATGRMTKDGAGEFRLADPGMMSELKIDEGTLTVSPLLVKGAEYHVDATASATLETQEQDGTNLITVWRDVDRPDRMLKPTTSRKPNFDTSHLIRTAFLTENAVGEKPMVDFGSFADANHPDGWGGSLFVNTVFGENNGLHEIFAVWRDYPEVKAYPYAKEGTKFSGPCLFGPQYYWFRGKGGNGAAFPMHYENAPGRMYGDLRVDGVKVNGQLTVIGDGVHVLAQRVTNNGAPCEEFGGNYQTSCVRPDGTTVQGVYGGLMIGEVLMFKDPISDAKRLRIEGALRGKWTGAVNEWSYDSLDVAAGATFKQPYTDLRVGSVSLAGTVVASSLRAETLTYSGDAAAVDGALELADGGAIEIQSDGAGGFRTLSASSVSVSGKGTIRFAVRPDDSLLGQEIKLVDSASVTLGSSGWKSTLTDLPTMRAYFVAKEDGLYVGFRPTGMMLIFR